MSLNPPPINSKAPFINQDIKTKRPTSTTNSVFRFNKVSQNNVKINTSISIRNSNIDQEEGEILDS
jgi:hypothetical protein